MRAAQQVHNLVRHLLGHGTVEVYLVHHGDDFQVVLEGEIEVGDGLGLDALRGVDHEECALAGGDGAADLVAEVHVPRRVDEVQRIVVVAHLDGVALDGDAALLFEVHIVEHLVLHFAGGDRVRHLQQAVCQRALAVVDMGYDAEVAYVLHRSLVSVFQKCKITNFFRPGKIFLLWANILVRHPPAAFFGFYLRNEKKLFSEGHEPGEEENAGEGAEGGLGEAGNGQRDGPGNDEDTLAAEA